MNNKGATIVMIVAMLGIFLLHTMIVKKCESKGGKATGHYGSVCVKDGLIITY